jgi:Rrf2 family protein
MASSSDEHITIKLVSENQHIPSSYLAKIMRKLVERGLLVSSSGPNGGYFFKKDPKEISLKEVYDAIEGDMQLVDCMDGDQVCELFKSCNQRSIWDHLQLNTLEFLSKISVLDLAKGNFKN